MLKSKKSKNNRLCKNLSSVEKIYYIAIEPVEFIGYVRVPFNGIRFGNLFSKPMVTSDCLALCLFEY